MPSTSGSAALSFGETLEFRRAPDLELPNRVTDVAVQVTVAHGTFFDRLASANLATTCPDLPGSAGRLEQLFGGHVVSDGLLAGVAHRAHLQALVTITVGNPVWRRKIHGRRSTGDRQGAGPDGRAGGHRGVATRVCSKIHTKITGVEE